MKIYGAVLIVAACTLLGFCRASMMEHNVKVVEDIIRALRYIKKQMALSQKVIAELVTEAAEYAEEAASVFTGCSEALGEGGTTFCEAWEKSVRDSGVCDKRTRQILSELGTQLGKNDIDGELATVAEILEKLTCHQSDISEKAQKEGRLCRHFGFAAGIIAVILLY